MNCTKHFDLSGSLTASCVARFMICWVCRSYFSGLVWSVLSSDECLIKINSWTILCMFSMPGESDLVESFVFGQGRIQIPSLACLFDFLIWNEWFTEMLWFNFILGSNFIFLCFKFIIKHYNTQKQKETKFEPRIKLNHNRDKLIWCDLQT